MRRALRLALLVLLLAGGISACHALASPVPAAELTRQAATLSAIKTPHPQITWTPQLTPITTAAPRLLERRLAVLDWPETIRVGESDVLRLSLVVDEQGNITPTASIGGHQTDGTPVEIPNLYDTYNLVAEARLDLAGVTVEPHGSISETMQPGREIMFSWSISPSQPGTFRGTLWIYLNLVPKAGGQAERRTLLAPIVEIRANSPLGLPPGVARWAGALGTVAATILGFPFLENLIKWLRRRLRRPAGLQKSA